jgi:hypothetical protein
MWAKVRQVSVSRPKFGRASAVLIARRIMPNRAPSRGLLAFLLGLLLGAAASLALPDANAAERSCLSVGEVSIAPDAEASPDLGRAVRAALNDELTRVSGLGALKRPWIVNATLTKLSTEKRDERTKASATISLALRRADDQVLFAELRGRASVEEATGNLATLRRAALQGAVRGAVARLPEALHRAP